MDNATDIVTEISRLRMEPGDTLVLKVPNTVSRLRSERLYRTVMAHLPPKTQCLVLDAGVDLAVLEAPPKDV